LLSHVWRPGGWVGGGGGEAGRGGGEGLDPSSSQDGFFLKQSPSVHYIRRPIRLLLDYVDTASQTAVH
jgi:hypothetical protein